MSKEIDYYYSHVSPWTYIGTQRFYAVAGAAGATINFKPANLGEIFAVSGGLPLGKRSPQRVAYRMMELKRWKAHLDIELTLEPKHFPTNDQPAALMAIAAMEAGHDVGPLSYAIMRKCWVEEADAADTATLESAADAVGLDGAALLAASEAPEIAEIYAANTAEAIERNIIGAPSYVYKDEIFWGQDRIDLLDRALHLD
jgi:2-hydroxychromene-2-carboxylate isomerase